MSNKYKRTADGKKTKKCKVGDYFEVVEYCSFDKGSVVKLEVDDGTNMPLFRLTSGGCHYNNIPDNEAGAYEFYSNMRSFDAPIKKRDTLMDVQFTAEELFWIWRVFGGCSGVKTYGLYEKASKAIKATSKVEITSLRLGEYEEEVEAELIKLYGE